MIIAEKKPIQEIIRETEPYDRILILGCNECVTVCEAGGKKEVEVLASALRMYFITQGKEKTFDEILNNGKSTFLDAEKQVFGIDHAEIAFELCNKWSIPESQGFAIKYHHYPSQSDKNSLAYIIHVADLIAMKGGIGTGRDALLYEFEGNALDFLGLSEDAIEDIMNNVSDSVDKILQQIHGPS